MLAERAQRAPERWLAALAHHALGSLAPFLVLVPQAWVLGRLFDSPVREGCSAARPRWQSAYRGLPSGLADNHDGAVRVVCNTVGGRAQ
jgi:hypothetical protein